MAFSDPEKNITQLGIVEGMRVADFGAGSGHYTLVAAKKAGADGKVYAFDVQQDMLAHVKEAARKARLGNVETVWADLDRPGGAKLADQTVDVVIISNVLFQVEHKDAFLKEAYRILKNGGRVLVIDWADSYGGMGPHPDHVLSERDARTLLEAAGFSIKNYIQAGDHHYGMIVRKG